MVTGDNLQTARAIALECGILSSEGHAEEPYLIEGRVFRCYSEQQRIEIAENILVWEIFLHFFFYCLCTR